MCASTLFLVRGPCLYQLDWAEDFWAALIGDGFMNQARLCTSGKYGSQFVNTVSTHFTILFNLLVHGRISFLLHDSNSNMCFKDIKSTTHEDY